MPVDYDKLARQHGGKEAAPAEPNYDALAAEAAAKPEGLFAAAAGADTIGSAPWYAKPMLAGHGPSVLQALEALPAVGGAIGGVLSSPGVATAAAGAAFGGATGESARQLIRRAIGAPVPQTSGEAAADIGKEALIQGVAEGAGGLLGKGLKAGGQGLMQSAVKPTQTTLKKFKTTPPKIVQTLLDEGVNVSPGGIERLQSLLNSTNAEISTLVKNAQGTIPRDVVAARVLPVAKRLSNQVNPTDSLKDVGKVVEDFMSQPVAGAARAHHHAPIPRVPRGPLTIPEAQAMKVGTYRQLERAYQNGTTDASAQAQQALARGLKEEIAAAVPEVSKQNAREAQLMAAREAVTRRVAVAGNRDPVGFAWVAHNPTTFLAALIDRAPVVKSMLARGMYKSAGAATKVSPQLIRAAVLALTTDDLPPEPAPQ